MSHEAILRNRAYHYSNLNPSAIVIYKPEVNWLATFQVGGGIITVTYGEGDRGIPYRHRVRGSTLEDALEEGWEVVGLL